MNKVKFTNAFDACVGHTGSVKTTNINGVRCTLYKNAGGFFYYELNGSGFSRFKSSQVFYDETAAENHAKELVDIKLK